MVNFANFPSRQFLRDRCSPPRQLRLAEPLLKPGVEALGLVLERLGPAAVADFLGVEIDELAGAAVDANEVPSGAVDRKQALRPFLPARADRLAGHLPPFRDQRAEAVD